MLDSSVLDITAVILRQLLFAKRGLDELGVVWFSIRWIVRKGRCVSVKGYLPVRWLA